MTVRCAIHQIIVNILADQKNSSELGPDVLDSDSGLANHKKWHRKKSKLYRKWGEKAGITKVALAQNPIYRRKYGFYQKIPAPAILGP